MGRILGIDYGSKRTGLAVTDPLRIIISPLLSITTEKLSDFITNYIKVENVQELVIGYPVHNDGTKTYLCAEIDNFLKLIASAFPNLKIHKIDESFSSSEAQQLMIQAGTKKKKRQEKGNLDMFSAVVILRRYLKY